MGCCGGFKGNTSPKSKKQSKSKKAVAKEVDTSCFKMYNDLRDLDLKVTKLYNHVFHSQEKIEERKIYMDINKFIRTLIVQLKHRCPDEGEMDELHKYDKFIEEKYNSTFGK